MAKVLSEARYGTLRGHVQSLGSDVVSDDKLGLVYPARIVIDRTQPDRSSGIRASSGREVDADIRTGRRRIISYLLGPINEAAHEAGREK